MARILGLDLGSYSLKAVLIDGSLRGHQVRGFAEVRRADGAQAETLAPALTDLLGRPGMQAEQVIIALPGPAVATHALTLPFTDGKRIDATVPFEVESQLPFDLDDAVFDYHPASQRDRKSELLVGVVRKHDLQSLLDALDAQSVDPKVVTHPALAYHNLLVGAAGAFPEAAANEAVAIVDVGHERSCLAMGRVGVGVEFARVISGGGRDLTRALADALQLPLPDAEAWKHARGSVGYAPQDAEDERASAALVRALQPLLRELRPSLKAYEARTREPVRRVYLCGGSAKLRGLSEQWANDLGFPVQVLRLPADAAESVPPEALAAAAQPYALAMRGLSAGARAARFNLRRGEFAFKGDYDYLKDRAPRMVAYGATLLALLVASGVVQNVVLAQREEQVDAMLCNTTQRVLGKCEKNFDRALNMLRGKESPAAELPRTSAVTLLAELTQRIPESSSVKLDDVRVELDRITVRCEAQNSKEIDALTTALKGFGCFREVKEGKVEKTRDGQRVRFPLEIQVQCPDTAQAPQG